MLWTSPYTSLLNASKAAGPIEIALARRGLTFPLPTKIAVNGILTFFLILQYQISLLLNAKEQWEKYVKPSNLELLGTRPVPEELLKIAENPRIPNIEEEFK